ncbi:MAG TPA: hypothetical protein VHE60_11215 [Pyrinomonadaceae bacterium]|nr:hypothetical protein [Pyrinomonadaceae bacterium]
MKSNSQSTVAFVATCTLLLLFGPARSFAQVSPAEILNPRLKALEQTHLSKLIAINQTVPLLTYSFPFSLNRYVGSDPKSQTGVDGRGLEFVNFHDQTVLKVTGNYQAAFDADRLTSNQRSSRVFNDVVYQVLEVLPGYFSSADEFDAVGFEICYHVRRKAPHYEYEGKEILVAVLSKADALRYAKAPTDSERQEILNRSEIFLNGKPFGLALSGSEPLDVATLQRSVKQPATAANQKQGAPSNSSDPANFARTGQDERATSETASMPGTAAVVRTRADAERLETKYKSQLDALAAAGLANYHFVQYAPPSFAVFRNQIFLQLTLRNPNTFDKEATSIYKRAARSFDLFVAPQLKSILERIPDDAELGGLDITVLNDLTGTAGHSSEAVEFVCPLGALRKFADADITNQDLINQSVVLVNGVRISLNLQQVE